MCSEPAYKHLCALVQKEDLMKRFDLLLDTNPPRSAYADGDKIERQNNEWVIIRGEKEVARFRTDRVIGFTVSEVEEHSGPGRF